MKEFRITLLPIFQWIVKPKTIKFHTFDFIIHPHLVES